MSLVERAVAIYESEGPSTDLVLCLRQQAGVLVDLGRLSEAAAVHDRAWQVNLTVGDVDQARLLMAERAWHLFEAGRRREALADGPGGDPAPAPGPRSLRRRDAGEAAAPTC